MICRLLIKPLILSWGPHPYDFQKAPPPNTSTLGVRASHGIWRWCSLFHSRGLTRELITLRVCISLGAATNNYCSLCVLSSQRSICFIESAHPNILRLHDCRHHGIQVAWGGAGSWLGEKWKDQGTVSCNQLKNWCSGNKVKRLLTESRILVL